MSAGRSKNAVWMAALVATMALGSTTLATGCGSFFQCEGKASCGTSGVSDTGNVVYASNSGSTNLYAYFIGSDGSLNTISGSPYALSAAPTSMVVTPDDSVLYVSNGGGIVSYAVSSTGALSNVTTQPVTLTPETSMVVTPNGKFLLALDLATTASNGIVYVREYAIGTSGALSTPTTSGATGFQVSTSTGQAITPNQIAVSPNGDSIALALGAAGYQIFPYNQGTGVIGTTGVAGSASSSIVGDHSVAYDASDNVYIARTNGGTGITGIVVYSTSTNTQLNMTPYATGNGPQSLVFANSYSYLYAANTADSTISQEAVSTAAALTSIGSAVAAPATVSALAVDKTGKFVLAEGTTASVGLQIFTIGTSGGLTAGKTATAGTANNFAPVLAVTH